MIDDPLLLACTDDPWGLAPAQRESLLQRYAEDQALGLALLRPWVEGPVPDPAVPAFLLATEPYRELREGLLQDDPPIPLRDRAERFADHFAGWGQGAPAPHAHAH